MDGVRRTAHEALRVVGDCQIYVRTVAPTVQFLVANPQRQAAGGFGGKERLIPTRVVEFDSPGVVVTGMKK